MFYQNITKIFTATTLLCCSTSASAIFHQWDINELYSNSDGSIQFVEFINPTAHNNEQFLSSTFLTSTDDATPNTFNFPIDLDTNISTANAFFLVGTAGFAALGIVTPDYIIPDSFLYSAGGTLTLGGADSITHGAVPTLDPGILSLNASASTGVNSPTNFSGASGSIGSVPIPGAFYLFATGLLALAGKARKATQ